MSGMHPGASPGDIAARPPFPWRFGAPGRAGITALLLALLLALVGGMGLALSGRTSSTPAERAVAATPAEAGFFDNLAGMQLTDQDGRGFRPAELAGKIVLVNFVFTGCAATCPTQTRELVALQRSLSPALRSDVRFLSISVDPLGDTPALLGAYGRSAGVDFASWSFVTGRPGDIERLGERLRLFRAGAAPARPEDHTTSLWLIDGSGRPMQRYVGIGIDTARVIRELGELKALRAAGSG